MNNLASAPRAGYAKWLDALSKISEAISPYDEQVGYVPENPMDALMNDQARK